MRNAKNHELEKEAFIRTALDIAGEVDRVLHFLDTLGVGGFANDWRVKA